MEEKNYFDKLNELDIDTTVGIGYSGDEVLYKEILGISYKVSEEKIKKLIDAFESKNYENYKILVHSVKSSTLNIGAISISEAAKALEQAGINRDYKYIENNHKKFIEAYQTLMDKLGNIILEDEPLENNIDKTECKGGLSEEQLKDNAKNIMLLLEELELDEAEILGRDMLLYNLDTKSRSLVIELVECLEHFDVEGAKQRIRQLIL